jgi:hypothetical protein
MYEQLQTIQVLFRTAIKAPEKEEEKKWKRKNIHFN